MAGLELTCTTGQQSTGTVAKTQMQVTANANVGLAEIDAVCDFEGVTSSDPKIIVELLRLKTNTGAGTSTAGTIAMDDPLQVVTPQAAAAVNFTAEPTWSVTKVLEKRIVHPQAGVAFRRIEKINGGEAIAIRTTPVSGTGPNCRCTMKLKE